MSLRTILLLLVVLLIFGAFGGSYGGYYPHTYAFGGIGTLLVIVLLVFLVLRPRL